MNYAKVGLIGNPNCGKTTLFNLLTGAKQSVGNWPGVTVERKSGVFRTSNWQFELIDLPGVYSLSVSQEASAVDEHIACQTILSGELDVVINILDATNLERNLFLTTQLLEMGVPVVVALNMMDTARKRRIQIDVETLERELGCPVVPISATQKTGAIALKQTLVGTCESHIFDQRRIRYPDEIEQAITRLVNNIPTQQHGRALALRALEGDGHLGDCLTQPVQKLAKKFQREIETQLNEEADILIANARYQFIQHLAENVINRSKSLKKTITHRLDKIILNRYLSIPIFLIMMYAMFVFAINIGGAFQGFFDISSDTIFVQGLGHFMQSMGSPGWLTAIIAAGFGKGINTVITFMPIIAGMFFFLSFLEGSGYMARAAFVMDRFMRAIGLPGKSFVPMIVGFGCNVPAIMAARTLEDRRDRVLTILMSPFMSCGARLAIFAIFTAAFFPHGGQNIVFALYFTGVMIAIITGLILRKTLLKGEPSPLVMELPPYRMPTLRSLLMQTWRRLKGFIFKAGKIIIPVSILIGALNTISVNGSLNVEKGSSQSVLSLAGKAVTPVLKPIGITQDNWPATVGLLTGVLAKEVVVATLNTLYTQEGHIQASAAKPFDFWKGLHAALISVPNNLVALKDSFTNPVLASAPTHDMNQSVLGIMYSHFDGQLGAFAYLLFILLYFPCVSATAAMVRELNRKWTLFSLCWTTGLAYGVAVIFYQTATIMRHPLSSLSWIMGVLATFFITIVLLKHYSLDESSVSKRSRGSEEHVSV